MDTLTGEVHALTQAVGELRKELADRNKRLKKFGAGVALVLALLGGVVVLAFDAASQADKNSTALAQVVEENRILIADAESDRTEVALLACQNRNSGQRSVRDSITMVLNVIVHRHGEPSPENMVLLEQIDELLDETPDRDCDSDGIVNANDYLD